MHEVIWGAFIALILALLGLDLGLGGRKEQGLSPRQALVRTAGWVALAVFFAIPVYLVYEHHWFGFGVGTTGHKAAVQYLSGWATEYALSLDNILVIALVFSHFGVPAKRQHRVLMWGILGALVMRGIMIALGAVLLQRFHWVIYVFGAILLIGAARMAMPGDREVDPEHNLMVRLVRRLVPVTTDFEGDHFIARLNGRLAVTPLFIVLLIIETTDVVFAFDSIPAIFGITQDPFLVFTSNIFAILGLRSLYFALAGLLARFAYINVGLVAILGFIGLKMLLSNYLHIADEVSLAVILGMITLSIVASMVIKPKTNRIQ